MKIVNYLLVFILLLPLYTCKQSVELNKDTPAIHVDDSAFILDENYQKGDVRRYGIYPHTSISKKNWHSLMRLASKGLPIVFPTGRYKTNLVFDSVSNIDFRFKNSTFTGAINILNNTNNIKLRGNLTVLDRVFVKHSNHIAFDTLNVKSDTLRSITRKKNRGVSIYAGTKHIKFQALNIENTGGTADKFYQHTASALQVHGWNNNPENLYIKTLHIKNADRTGIYLTGVGHKIEKAIITDFGLGSTKNMFALGDAQKGEEAEFSGAWINRCSSCDIDTLMVNVTKNKPNYSLKLDEGKYYEPTFIYNVHFSEKAKALPIKDDKLTNILVKNEF